MGGVPHSRHIPLVPPSEGRTHRALNAYGTTQPNIVPFGDNYRRYLWPFEIQSQAKLLGRGANRVQYAAAASGASCRSRCRWWCAAHEHNATGATPARVLELTGAVGRTRQSTRSSTAVTVDKTACRRIEAVPMVQHHSPGPRQRVPRREAPQTMARLGNGDTAMVCQPTTLLIRWIEGTYRPTPDSAWVSHGFAPSIWAST